MNTTPQTYRTRPIERAGGLTPDIFNQRYLEGYGKPVIVTDAIASWKALSRWSFDEFRARYGSDKVGPRVWSGSRLLKLMALRDYLDNPDGSSRSLWIDSETKHPRQAPAETPAPLYLVWNVFGRHPELLEDIELSPKFVEDWQPFLPVALRKTLDEATRYFAAGLLIGPKNAQIGLHHDFLVVHTYVAQIIGRKRCLLFSPEDSAALYNGMVNVDEPDLEKFPLLQNATAYECILAPGEVLFIPHHWWHHVVSLDKVITANYNFFNHVNFGGYLTGLMRDLPSVMDGLAKSPDARAALGIAWTCRGSIFPIPAKCERSPACYTAAAMTNHSYSLAGYGEMIADRVRIDAFTQALRRGIRPGAVVMDIGTGPGCMAVLACKLGASRVYAIEPCAVIQIAREIAAANPCGDKIEFFEDFSTKVTIPVLADIIVSDMRGILPLFGQHIPSIVDARRRFLAPGGTLIAREDRIWAAVVDAPKEYSKIVDPWDRNPLGQDLGVARRKVLNEYRKVRVTPDQLLTPPQLWAMLDYATIESPDVRGTLQWKTERNGTGHGILVWFDMELADGVEFSNGPASPEAIYGSAFFPWLEPVPLAAGQNVCVDIEAKLLEKDYFWRWTTHIASEERPSEIAVRFEQSQLQGSVLSLATLRKSASDYVPLLSEEGLLRRRTFVLMDGKSSLEDIARRLTAEFPLRFTRWQQALSFAGAISKENSR